MVNRSPPFVSGGAINICNKNLLKQRQQEIHLYAFARRIFQITVYYIFNNLVKKHQFHILKIVLVQK